MRSDFLRELTKAALAQGFVLDPGGKHLALICPVCSHREVITKSGRQTHHEAKSKVSRLRHHGLIWKGTGGRHDEIEN
jgi:hypothetical protein